MQAEIRTASEADFPDRKRFEEMKRQRRLRSPDDAGRDVADHLLSEAFGREAVMDLRKHGRWRSEHAAVDDVRQAAQNQ